MNIVFIFQVNNVWLSEFKLIAWGYRATEWQNWVSDQVF